MAQSHPRNDFRLNLCTKYYALRYYVLTQSGGITVEQILVTRQGASVIVLPESRVAVV